MQLTQYTYKMPGLFGLKKDKDARKTPCDGEEGVGDRGGLLGFVERKRV